MAFELRSLGLIFHTYRCDSCKGMEEADRSRANPETGKLELDQTAPVPPDDPTVPVELRSDGIVRCEACEAVRTKMRDDPDWRPPGHEAPQIQVGETVYDSGTEPESKKAKRD